MAVEDALYTLLNAGASAVTGRIYPMLLPQNPTYPAITYMLIDADRPEDLSGGIGLAVPQFQIDSWADDPDEMRTLATQVRQTLHGYNGNVSGLVISGISFVTEHDQFEPTTRIYRRMTEFNIWHTEVP